MLCKDELRILLAQHAPDPATSIARTHEEGIEEEVMRVLIVTQF
jgi:hypothetical protein